MRTAKLQKQRIVDFESAKKANNVKILPFHPIVRFMRGKATICHCDSSQIYHQWLPPTLIISDGPYGLGSYEGDPPTPDNLVEFYAPHLAEWSKYAKPDTTLWFWNSELGWASVHNLIQSHGWEFRNCHIWNIGNSPEADDIILGIELKGWYLLAKDAEPSFRFQVTPSACAVQDLIVVVPWALNNVISGSPKVFVPYVGSSKYAAVYRNYHWQHLRQAKSNTSIKSPKGISPYPKKSDPIADKPVSDGGGNFGRFARTGLMDSYLNKAKEENLCGITAEHWLTFFKVFQDQNEMVEVREQIERIKAKVLARVESEGNTSFNHIREILMHLDKIIEEF